MPSTERLPAIAVFPLVAATEKRLLLSSTPTVRLPLASTYNPPTSKSLALSSITEVTPATCKFSLVANPLAPMLVNPFSLPPGTIVLPMTVRFPPTKAFPTRGLPFAVEQRPIACFVLRRKEPQVALTIHGGHPVALNHYRTRSRDPRFIGQQLAIRVPLRPNYSMSFLR